MTEDSMKEERLGNFILPEDWKTDAPHCACCGATCTGNQFGMHEGWFCSSRHCENQDELRRFMDGTLGLSTMEEWDREGRATSGGKLPPSILKIAVRVWKARREFEREKRRPKKKMKKIMKGFVVDLDEGRPFCSECRQDAHKMDLGEYKAYICTNHACPNTNELRHYSDDSWESADAGEIWGEENVQAVLLTLLDKTYTGPME